MQWSGILSFLWTAYFLARAQEQSTHKKCDATPGGQTFQQGHQHALLTALLLPDHAHDMKT